MADPTWRHESRTFGGPSARLGQRQTTSVTRASAMRALGSVVYAARLTDGKIKIGWTEHFDLRLHWLKHYTGQDVELLAFRLGDYVGEQALHASLIEHRASGSEYATTREYYDPTPEVLATVNQMRGDLNLPPLAA